jgi:hypothetical protein
VYESVYLLPAVITTIFSCFRLSIKYLRMIGMNTPHFAPFGTYPTSAGRLVSWCLPPAIQWLIQRRGYPARRSIEMQEAKPGFQTEDNRWRHVEWRGDISFPVECSE